MKLFITLVCLLVTIVGSAQPSETHNFVTYDTTVNLVPLGCPACAKDKWNIRISRPKNMFVAGDPDTASRPMIFSMPGQGELGVDDMSKLVVYGPHYWMNNGWDGGVTLSNGKHYPIIITACYVNNVYPSAVAYYGLLTYLLNTYHIKRNSVHLAGLSQGAFTAGALIQFEQTAGAETGMKLVTTLTCFEGTPNELPAPYSTWTRGFTAYKVWAKKYGGHYFYLEGSGSDNFRDGWQYANAMNDTVPNSAYFSYEDLGGGAHCCWNSMYDPNATNWTCVGTLGPNNAPSQVGKNTMGDYKAPSSVFQWMLQHGDTSLVGGGTTTTPVTLTPVANAGSNQTVTLPVSSATLTGTGTETGGTIKSYLWTQVSGPSTATIATAAQAATTVSALVAGTYVFQLKVTDANGTAATAQVSVIVNPAVSSGSSGTTYQSIPGTIQAESYASMSGVATETTSDTGGGLDVGWIDAGDKMTYNINVATAGNYTVGFRVASINTGASFKLLDAKGNTLATVTVPNTGGWQVWSTVNATVTLAAGQQTMSVVSQNTSGWNINWMQFAAQVTTPPASTPPASSTPTTPSGKVIPGTVQAEDFDYSLGIATGTTTDTGGGLYVGWLGSVGNQMWYNVTVTTAGTYTASFRVASPVNGATFKLLDAKNNLLTTVNVPNTGGWQTWGNVSATVTLPAGAATIKLVSLSANGFNLNWMQFVSATTTAATVSRQATTASSFDLSPSADVAQPEHVYVYPNPAGSQVSLEIANSVSGSINIKVINAMGVTVKSFQWKKEAPVLQQTLSLSGLPTGLYFIRMQAEGWGETRKILKK